jgi:hypothetical protein
MADDEQDPKVSRRYRDLGREEPPRELDAKILAAARRTGKMRPAPLVPPTGRRRWYFPVAAAAIIALAVAVTVHMERERPDPELVLPTEKQAEPPRIDAPAPIFTPDPKPAPSAPPLPQAAPPVEESRERAAAADAQRELQNAAARSAPQMGAQAMRTEEVPERTLERIAELRRQGLHEEADKLLEAFRKRYPDYKIPEAALRK